MKQADKIVNQAINESKVQKTTRKDIEFYKTGITLLDLCLGGGFGKGYISNICGWEATGKTILACETLGYNHKYIKNFKHKFDNSESGFTLDTKYLYNFDINMIEPRSEKVEQFMFNVENTISRSKTDNMIYVLDSLDGLSDDREAKKHKKDMNKIKKSIEENKESDVKGDYGGKAKLMSEFFRLNSEKINKSGMNLMITSQLRDKIGVMFGKKEERSGGKALNFYAAQIVWLYLRKKLTKKITIDGNKYERNTENLVQAKVTKNKLGKSFRDCYLFLDSDFGIDNIKSNIYFLYNLITPEGDLRNLKEIKWEDKKFTSIYELILYIEKNNLEKDLENKVINLWNKIEKASSPERKRKY
jgi:RecA/RadA recombinase